jgi:hypothetical protein
VVIKGSSAGRCRRFLAAALTLGATACGPSPITPVRVDRAIAPTFANLVATQVSWMGIAPMAAADFGVTASCRRPVGNSIGSGEWVCTLLWKGPNGQALRDIYDVFVTPDGCYTATVEGETLGGPVLTAAGGRRVRNLLYAFEGCFEKS